MIVDFLSFAPPGFAVVLEVANQFALFSIDADDGQISTVELAAFGVDEHELSISPGTLPGLAFEPGFDIFSMGLEREIHHRQQPPHRVGTHLDSDVKQLPCNFAGRAARPSQAADGVTGHILFQELFDTGEDLRRFFSADGRPPPALRTRSSSMSPCNHCVRPRATV